mmetsp:Transcript_41258/g.65384  ORF Transcript_41258/g.65384 Transcript_41258/m.65384 type:complete len:97 (-) Transcript_41258:11-301(-)
MMCNRSGPMHGFTSSLAQDNELRNYFLISCMVLKLVGTCFVPGAERRYLYYNGGSFKDSRWNSARYGVLFSMMCCRGSQMHDFIHDALDRSRWWLD